MQYVNGLFGPMIIYGSRTAAYDIDLGPVLLTDWYHQTYESASLAFYNQIPFLKRRQLTTIPSMERTTTFARIQLFLARRMLASPFSVSNPKKKHSDSTDPLRQCGYTEVHDRRPSVDRECRPRRPHSTLYHVSGSARCRPALDIIVQATDSPTDAVYMRANIGPGNDNGCSLNADVSPLALAAIYYERANTAKLPTTTTPSNLQNLRPCPGEDVNQIVPYYSLRTLQPDLTLDRFLDIKSNGIAFIRYVNNSSFITDCNTRFCNKHTPVTLPVHPSAMSTIWARTKSSGSSSGSSSATTTPSALMLCTCTGITSRSLPLTKASGTAS